MLIEELRTLVAVAGAGSIAVAAVRRGYAQPTVSGHVQALERHLGFPLLLRTPHGSELTLQGVQILPAVLDVLASVEALERRAENIQGGAGARAVVTDIRGAAIGYSDPRRH